MNDMLLAVDYELFRRERTGRPGGAERLVPPDRSKTGCEGVSCRLWTWTGRTLVRWGLRLQERYGAPEAGHALWAAGDTRQAAKVLTNTL
jgi:hypothetical protein